MQSLWNERFAGPGHKYGTEPNAFVREQAARLAVPSQVLVPGDGEGRNSVWLAGLGHQVLAVDYAENGLAKARALAAERGPEVAGRLRTEWADLASWQPPAERFDAVVLSYVHLASTERQAAHRRLLQALKPGGWLILEAFHPSQLSWSSGGPKDSDMLYTVAQLQADFAELREVLAWDGVVTLSEGAGHQGPGHVSRYLGQR